MSQFMFLKCLLYNVFQLDFIFLTYSQWVFDCSYGTVSLDFSKISLYQCVKLSYKLKDNLLFKFLHSILVLWFNCVLKIIHLLKCYSDVQIYNLLR